jgi:hypothetical protein
VSTDERQFDVYDVLAVTHRLPATGSQFQGILEYVSGQSLPGPSHALGVREPSAEWLFEQHPQLRDVPPLPDFHDDERAMDEWADQQKARLGATELTVRPLPADRQEQIKPRVERLLDHAEPAKVWVADAAKPNFGLER